MNHLILKSLLITYCIFTPFENDAFGLLRDNKNTVADVGLVGEAEGTDLYNMHPSVGTDGLGGFAVVWYDERNKAKYQTEFGDIYCQLFDSNGKPSGHNFVVNDVAGSVPRNASLSCSVVMNSNGTFAVVWRSIDFVLVQLFKKDGNRINKNFTVGERGWETDVAIDENGNFAVVTTGIYGFVYCKKYNSNGNPAGDLFRVNDDGNSGIGRSTPKIAMNQSGNFVICWMDSRTGGFEVYCQIYNSDCSPRGNNFVVNDYIGDSFNKPSYPDVVIDRNGRFIIVWQDKRNDIADIYCQNYSDDGSKLGKNYQVCENSYSGQYFPSIGIDGNGNFTIVWAEFPFDLSSNIIFRRFNKDRYPLGHDTYAYTNNKYYNNIVHPDIAMHNAGGFVIAWDEYRSTTLYNLKYGGDGLRLGDVVKINEELNIPPLPPTIIQPTNNSFFNDRTISFRWNNPDDQNSNPLHFKIDINDMNDFGSLVKYAFTSSINSEGFNPIPPVPQGCSICSFTPPSPLDYGTYWWRVTAFDGYEYGERSEIRSFNVTRDTTEICVPDTIRAAAGQTIDVPVIVSTKDTISIAQVTFEYNQSVIKYTGADVGQGARNFIISNENRNLSFDPASPSADKNVLIQLLGGVRSTFTGDSSEILVLHFQVIGSLNSSSVLSIDRDPLHTNLTAGNTEQVPVTQFGDGVVKVGGSTGVHGKQSEASMRFQLWPNYPNPFNQSTKIRFSLPEERKVIVRILNLRGAEVDRLMNGENIQGDKEILWNAGGLPSGIYYCRIKAGYDIKTQKLIYMK